MPTCSNRFDLDRITSTLQNNLLIKKEIHGNERSRSSRPGIYSFILLSELIEALKNYSKWLIEIRSQTESQIDARHLRIHLGFCSCYVDVAMALGDNYLIQNSNENELVQLHYAYYST